jgi:hypothetical protein
MGAHFTLLTKEAQNLPRHIARNHFAFTAFTVALSISATTRSASRRSCSVLGRFATNSANTRTL